MPQITRPATKIKVVPRDGEIEITLNINITVDGKVAAYSEQAETKVEDEDYVPHIIPDFGSGMKLDFGK